MCADINDIIDYDESLNEEMKYLEDIEMSRGVSIPINTIHWR